MISNSYIGVILLIIGNLVNFIMFDLNINNLLGSIFESIGNLINFNWFSFFCNNLSGELFLVIGDFLLVCLYLWDNNLFGCILSSFENFCGILFREM